MDHQSTYLFCRRYLEENETVLWHGAPERKGLFMSKYDLWFLYFAIGWTIVNAPLLLVPFITNQWDPMIVGFCIIFPAVGVLMIVTHIRKHLRKRDNTEYAITNKRIFRRVGIDVEEFYLNPDYLCQVVNHKNGTTTIKFPELRDLSTMVVNRYYQCFSIRGIADPYGAQQALARMELEPKRRKSVSY